MSDEKFPLVQPCATFEEWMRLRGSFIGASEAAAIVGMNPHKTAGEVWLSKIRAQEALAEDAPLPDEIPNRFSYWGSKQEPIVLEWFAEDTGYEVTRLGLTICRHPELPFIAATLDARAVSPHGDKSVVEAKTQDAFVHMREREWGPSMSREMPERHIIQVWQQLGVLQREGFTLGWLAVLIGGNDARRYPVEYDAEAVEILFEQLASFWSLVERREPPPFDYADKNALRLQRQIWNKVEGTSIVVPANYQVAPSQPTVMELIIEHDDYAAVEELAKARKDAAKAQLVHIAGNHARVEIEGTGIAIVRKQKAGYHVPAYDVEPKIETSFTPRLTKKRKEILDGFRGNQVTGLDRAAVRGATQRRVVEQLGADQSGGSAEGGRQPAHDGHIDRSGDGSVDTQSEDRDGSGGSTE